MVVLVTGTSGGVGGVLAKTLASKGMTVYGTERHPEQPAENATYAVLPMEIENDASVAACIKEIVTREGRIDAVVNCVNQMRIGSVEEQSVDEVRALYEVDVFGALRLCKQVIPTMREQGQGSIVLMSSLGGILAVPYMSAYTSAKFALEALGEALYHEVKPYGIDVVIMQPVAMKIDRPATGGHLDLVEGVTEGSRSHAMLERMTRDTEASSLTPERVSEKIAQVLVAQKKPLRVPMDKAKALGLVKRLAPQFVIDRLIAGLLGGRGT